VPNSNERQNDCIICHLLQVKGQKKPLYEIKASLKQAVKAPSDYNRLGTQIHLFSAVAIIFAGDESVCIMSLRQLLLQVTRNNSPQQGFF
jgi:hypothetical protein